MKTTTRNTLAMAMVAALAAAPALQAQEESSARVLSPAIQVLAPAADAAPAARVSNEALATKVAPAAGEAVSWETWAGQRHAHITARVLRETEQRILGIHDHAPTRLAHSGQF